MCWVVSKKGAGLANRLLLTLAVLLLSSHVTAQLQLGGLKVKANGDIAAGYAGDYGNDIDSDHSMQFGGDGAMSGYYYHPKFLAFDASGSYNRSQANSGTGSLSNSSNYNASANFFSGSHFPGYVNISEGWDQSGLYGIPGLAGLTTKDSQRGVSVGWSEAVPGLPTIGIGFGHGSGSSEVLGGGGESSGTHTNFSATLGYRLLDFPIRASYGYGTGKTDSTLAIDQSPTESASETNSYSVGTSHRLPLHGQFGVSFGHESSNYNTSQGVVPSSGNNLDGGFGLGFKRLPVNFSFSYSDNLYADLEESIVASGGTPVPLLISSKSQSYSYSGSTSYTLYRVNLNAGANYQEQVIQGQAYSATQFNANANYNFGRRFKGLAITAGLVDTADKNGNEHTGLMSNVDYNRPIGRWEVEGSFHYDQDVQTLLVLYTTSSLSYGARVKREFGQLKWSSSFNGSHSGIQQQAGNGNHAETFMTTLMWKRLAAGGSYSESRGVSVGTAAGLSTALPTPIISASQLIAYDGTGYGFSLSGSPIRHLSISGAYSRSHSDTNSSSLVSINDSTSITAYANFDYRKLHFVAGYSKAQQSISAGGLPTTLNSYYFGITRWFKLF
jgi:hypothetical protein